MTAQTAPRYLSGAMLDVTTVAMPVGRAAVLQALPSSGLTIAPVPGLPAHRHVVIADFFCVHDGAVELGGMPQGRWLDAGGSVLGAGLGSVVGSGFGATYGALAGATMAGYMGLWYGPAAWFSASASGWAMGAACGSVAGTLSGMRRGLKLGTQVAERSARRLSRTLGSYREVMIAIPNVVLTSHPNRRHLFVLHMYTDSALAKWGDQTFGFGFGKQSAVFVMRPFQSLSVRDGSRELIAAAFTPVDESDWQVPAAGSLPLAARDWLAQPLLGCLADGRMVSSRLDRSYDNPRAAWALPADTHLTLAEGVLPGVRAGIHRLRPASEDTPWGVFHTRSVMSRVSYPDPRDARLDSRKGGGGAG